MQIVLEGGKILASKILCEINTLKIPHKGSLIETHLTLNIGFSTKKIKECKNSLDILKIM